MLVCLLLVRIHQVEFLQTLLGFFVYVGIVLGFAEKRFHVDSPSAVVVERLFILLFGIGQQRSGLFDKRRGRVNFVAFQIDFGQLQRCLQVSQIRAAGIEAIQLLREVVILLSGLFLQGWIIFDITDAVV